MVTENLNNDSQINVNEISLLRKIFYLIHLYRIYISIGFSAPFVAGAIFSYISLGFSSLPSLFALIIPILVGFFMGCGFFALDSYYDVETDRLNPRKKSLPHIFDRNLLPKWVGLVSALIFFSLGIILSVFLSIIHLFLAMLGVGAGILYTTPPFRFKAKTGLDILINVLAFGMIGSVYGWFIYSDFTGLISMYGWFVVPISCMLTFIIVYPTPMIDYEADKAANVKTTVVTVGLEKYAKIGFIALTLIFIAMSSIELKIYFDFNTYSHLKIDLPILIGLLLTGCLTYISYYILYRRPTPKTAFYMTGLIAISLGLGAILALQVADVFFVL